MMLRALALVFAILCPISPASGADSVGGREGEGPIAVDLELVLAVDISFSVSMGEQDVQRRGYAAAFRDPALVRAITSGMTGRIGVVYLEWAGPDVLLEITPWTLIDGPEAAARFADALEAAAPHRGGRTSISAAFDKAGALFADSPFESWRRVLDISGDGPNNAGAPVRRARDGLVALGVVVNGLPLVGAAGDGAALVDIEAYYRDCVIGGPGAFYLTVDHWRDFDDAIKRKLILEIAGRRPAAPAPVIQAALRAPAAADCLAGEKAARRDYIDRLNDLTGGKSERWAPREEDWPTPAE